LPIDVEEYNLVIPPLGINAFVCRTLNTMRFANRYHVVLTIVALLGFNGPICAMACSLNLDSPTAPISSEAHGGCHDSDDKSQGESRRHDCELRCDASALPTSNETPLEPTLASLDFLVDSSASDADALDLVVRVTPTWWEPPDRRRILLLKSSLQI